MSDTTSAEALSALLSRMPGVAWSCRTDPQTGKSTWVHIDATSAELYDVPYAELRDDPLVLHRQLVPEDSARHVQEFGQSLATQAPLFLWLAASEEAKSELIEKLRYSIDELSNPILEVWDDVLLLPIIGVIDSRRTSDMVQRLLTEVTRAQASFVIIDLTGVEIVDTTTADHLMKLMRKVEIVGARCVLTGIRAAVAETLVDIGVDFARVTTLRNLKHGLREALRFARREREGSRSSDLDLDLSEQPARQPRRD